MNIHHYDCIVVGGGHAGVEAALASSRMGLKTLMVVINIETIGQMSCNPAIGGVGKGQLVKEIDALGGEMARAADKTAIQFRQLNTSRGQAVRSSRCQSDRMGYKLYMRRVVEHQKNLDVRQDKVAEVLVKDGRVRGIKTGIGTEIYSQAVILAPGTFLKGRLHIGLTTFAGGRIGEPASDRLAQNLKDLGLETLSFKTGTPPRLDGRTIDFKKLESQFPDKNPVPFSFSTKKINQKLIPCHIAHTNEKTHEIIRANLNRSAMYSGVIKSTGVRYCPSIEDKIVRFSDKKSHQVFLEPEGIDTFEYYPNGISTSLPFDVQEQLVHSIKGLESARIIRPGYAIEHGVVVPTELYHSLETKKIQNLFLAGQINGTTGYEEAASQGIMAGINAALKIKGKDPFILERHQSYIGVLIDDLTTKGTDEPYRMFTSRVEYRLIVREDNADKRLSGYGYEFGLIEKRDYSKICRKYAAAEKEIEHLKKTYVSPSKSLDAVLGKINSSPLKRSMTLSDILKRPGVTYDMIAPFDGKLKKLPATVIDQVEYEIKYEGFIQRQLKDVQRFKSIENIKIPPDFDYSRVSGLSTEIRQKLKKFSPLSLGQANRISGVTPAAISILMIYLRKKVPSAEAR
ncbi:MAG TPA: tRNA uridine-5-carboxymethylaminomethyl(34) synthesis enzyme MnmG [Candidatus Omnitrophota bacterium]|nr:tRNA uridine-5-carboxymethylaminomethyl(34) synthesis enzyme MnmG [Candidatus Omnitrophota bacterium]HPD84652.1 tRNA uridine-5-carboxymethylaminomethyl(34) synthesis enzyme MnmG [Candidatus Omnitrophota bacterium]HRZ03510.1 tRNA uridine-5-carboxymethylaminomethyl(34) synthesis enzyme MnmG [Candidatus Omnitrophota bacterium]